MQIDKLSFLFLPRLKNCYEAINILILSDMLGLKIKNNLFLVFFLNFIQSLWTRKKCVELIYPLRIENVLRD